MKNYVSYCLIILLTTFFHDVNAQTALKIRASYAPVQNSSFAVSNALGIERTFTERLSGSLLISYSAINHGVFDGPVYSLLCITPEVKYFLSSKDGFNTGSFLAMGIGNEQFMTIPYFNRMNIPKQANLNITPHLTFGRNTLLRKKWYIETYFGVKYGIRYFEGIITDTDFYKWGFEKLAIRGGINVGYILK